MIFFLHCVLHNILSYTIQLSCGSHVQTVFVNILTSGQIVPGQIDSHFGISALIQAPLYEKCVTLYVCVIEVLLCLY